MPRYPYMPLYVPEFQLETIDLTLAQKGAYISLLTLAWQRGGSIPNDSQWLKRALGVHGRTYNLVVLPLLSRFFELDCENYWRNASLSKSIEKATKFNRKQSENASKRWADSKEINDLADATAMPIRLGKVNKESKNIINPDIQVESKLSPIGEETDFVSEDGTVVVTTAELQQWIEDYPLVKNIPGRLRNSCRTWLKDIPADERQHVFVMHLEKQQRQREEKVPKAGPRKIPLYETDAYKQDVERERAQKEREKALGRLQ